MRASSTPTSASQDMTINVTGTPDTLRAIEQEARAGLKAPLTGPRSGRPTTAVGFAESMTWIARST